MEISETKGYQASVKYSKIALLEGKFKLLQKNVYDYMSEKVNDYNFVFYLLFFFCGLMRF